MRELGRGLVLLAGQEVPSPWQDCPRHQVDQASPELLHELHRCWRERIPAVWQLAVTTEELREAEIHAGPVYDLGGDFEFRRERLHSLLWANNYDGTRGAPIWWHGRLARRLGASEDLEIDGGPRCHLPTALVHRESVEEGSLRPTRGEAEIPSELADDQRAAVRHRGGAARILAPAGSGKTRVLTERLKYLLDCGVEPQRIMAVAYNRRAALEMRQRVPEAQASISTLHALGYSWLRRELGLKLATDRDLRGLLQRLVKPPPMVNQDPLQPYLEALSQIRLGLRQPEEVESQRQDVPGLARAFPEYRGLLRERGWVDHDEQIYSALELLLTRPDLRKQWQRRCCHLLVDEFQDLTPAFLLMVRLLSGGPQQVFAVGDDDQVIYGYAGATPEYLVQFERYFSGASSYLLQRNYRCPAPVVEAAQHLLRRNRVRVAKEVEAIQSEGDIHCHLVAPAAACQRALDQLLQWRGTFGEQEMAVLARVNALLLPVQLGLQQLGIPCNRAVDESLLERTGIRSALAYLRLCLEPDRMDGADLRDALRRPNRMLRREILEKAAQCRTLQGLRRYAYQLDAWPSEKLEEFCADLGRLRKRLDKGLAAFFTALRTETEFLSALDQLDSAGLGASGASHRDDLLALEQCVSAFSGSPADFCDWLLQTLQQPPAGNGIHLSSVHRVKGQEWPCVLVYGVDQGMFPHRLSQDVEEERRILHVAITRAGRHCVLLADAQNPSPMLAEMQAPAAARAPKKKKKKKKKS